MKQPIFHGGMLLAVCFVTILLANRFLSRFWCRVLCPLVHCLASYPMYLYANSKRCGKMYRLPKNVSGTAMGHVPPTQNSESVNVMYA